MDVKFYVADEIGWVLNETCGCPNSFSTYKEAFKVCKKVSKKNPGKFRVAVRLPNIQFENGKGISL